MYPAIIYVLLGRGNLRHHLTIWSPDFVHAEAVCNQCREQDKEGRHFLVCVLSKDSQYATKTTSFLGRTVHVYSTKDYIKPARGGRRVRQRG